MRRFVSFAELSCHTKTTQLNCSQIYCHNSVNIQINTHHDELVNETHRMFLLNLT